MKRSILSFLLLMLYIAPIAALAQQADFGTDYLTGVGLGSQDVRLTVVNIIRVALGILGLLFLILIIYGVIASGSGGRDGGAERGKKIIAGAVIGLIIIIIAYAATTFIFNSIIEATPYTAT